MNMMQKIAKWGNGELPWPDDLEPKLPTLQAELAEAKRKFSELGEQVAAAHRKLMAIKDGPSINLDDHAAKEAYRQAHRSARLHLEKLRAERETWRAKALELEPQVTQLEAAAKRGVVEAAREQHAALLRRMFLRRVEPIADSIAAEAELTVLLDELKRRGGTGGLPSPPLRGSEREAYKDYRTNAVEMIEAGVLKVDDLPPQLAAAWRLK